MAGPGTPSAEGPTFAPPHLPAGWIAQWDGSSKKYYYVQLATGVSQWETPTQAVQTGNTPAQQSDHPFGTPAAATSATSRELITHPDGSQTVRHADGTMEPILPENMRGAVADGPGGDRGLGSMAMNALLSSGKQSGSSNHGSSSSPLVGLAGQFLGGSSGSNHGKSSSSTGKIVGQLASSFLSSANHTANKPEAPTNYHGGHTQGAAGHAQGGLAGSVMGGVANMFGGNKPGHSGQDYGYSNSGSNGGYSGQAPTYHAGGSGSGTPSSSHHHSSSSSIPPPSSSYGGGHQSSHNQYSHSPQQQQHGHQQYAPPSQPPQHGGYGHQQPSYGGHQQPSYGGHQQYAPPPGPPPGAYGAPAPYGGGPPGAPPSGYPGQSQGHGSAYEYGGQGSYGAPQGYGSRY